MTSPMKAVRECLTQGFELLRDAAAAASGTELCDILSLCETYNRQLDQIAVTALADARREDLFGANGYRSEAAALADLLRWEPRRSRRFATAAAQVVPDVTLTGEVLPAKLTATATVFADGHISMRHVEVIASLLDSKPAQRIAPDKQAAAEHALAGQAPDCTPAELRVWGSQLIDALDQDGPEPDDRPEPQINELRITRFRDRPGGTLRGHYEDAEMFERIVTVLDAHAGPGCADDPRDHSERQADALAEVCGYALAHAPSRVVPDAGGRRPQVVVTIRLDDLQNRARSALLDLGDTLTPAALRMLACDAAVIPAILGGHGEPLDIGRAQRAVPDGMRRAVIARDHGCAFPGCDRPPGWCDIHHVLPWEHGGPTEITNLTMLCRAHHRLVHHSGWAARITNGRPEFVPPGWIDPRRRPRRKPDPTVLREPTSGSGAPAAQESMETREFAAASVGTIAELGPPAIRVADFTDLDTL